MEEINKIKHKTKFLKNDFKLFKCCMSEARLLPYTNCVFFFVFSNEEYIIFQI